MRIDDTGAAGDPYEDFLAGGSPEPVESWLEDEEETISINYTSGTTGRPKGVMYSHRGAWVNAVGEVVETGMTFDSDVPLDAADVPLQRLVLHVGGHRGRAAPTSVSARSSPARIWELIDAEGITHYNGAPTVQIGVVNDPKAHRLDAAGDGDGGRRAALADAARQAQGARLPAGARLRPHRDLRAAHRLRLARGVGRAARRRAGAAGRPPGPGLRALRSRARGGRRDERRAARRRDDGRGDHASATT